MILHLGTTVAILVYYRREIATGLRGLLGAEDVPTGSAGRRSSASDILAAIATSPLIPLALFLKKWIEEAFEGITMAGIGFLITAAMLLLTAWLSRRDGTKGPAETTWLDALLIGLAQMFAPLPGVSRSGLTIAAGLALGLSRPWAVGFSLLIAVPAILGAVAKELKDMVDAHAALPTADYVAQAIVATIVAGLVGYAAITWLVRIVPLGTHLVFLCILDRSGGVGPGRRDPTGDPPMTGERVLWTGPYGAATRDYALAGASTRPVESVAGALADGARPGPSRAGWIRVRRRCGVGPG